MADTEVAQTPKTLNPPCTHARTHAHTHARTRKAASFSWLPDSTFRVKTSCPDPRQSIGRARRSLLVAWILTRCACGRAVPPA